MKSLPLIVAVIGIPLLYSCIPNSETALEPQYPTMESPSLTDQVENCLVSLNDIAMDELTSEPYFYYRYNMAYVSAYERASEIIANNLMEEADWLLFRVLSNKNDWDIKEISTNVYSVSGYGLGYSDEQLSYGEWYYYESPKTMEPRSSASKKLKDAITGEGEFAPKVKGLFPDGEQSYEFIVPVTEIPYIWETILLGESYISADSYTLVVSKNADLSDACTAIESDDQYYISREELDYETTYFWIVTGWENDCYVVGQSPIHFFITEKETKLLWNQQEAQSEEIATEIELAATQAAIARQDMQDKMDQAREDYEAYEALEWVPSNAWIMMPGQTPTGPQDIVFASSTEEAKALGFDRWIPIRFLESPGFQTTYMAEYDEETKIKSYPYLKGITPESLGDLWTKKYEEVRNMVYGSIEKETHQMMLEYWNAPR